MRALCVAMLACAGCIVGAGPSIGRGRHRGWFVGGEVSAGLPFVQASAGYQHPRRFYLRGDAGWDSLAVSFTDYPTWRGGGRLGGGLVFDHGRYAGGMFDLGGSAAFLLDAPQPCRDRARWPAPVAVVWLDWRVVRGDQELVLTPRIELQGCADIRSH